MRKKDIEKRIIFEAKELEVPDVKQQILSRIPNRKIHIKKEKKHGTFAIRLSYMMSVFIVLMLAIVFINNYNDANSDSINQDENNEIITNTQTPPNSSAISEVTNAEKAYAKGAATLTGFVSNDDTLLQPVTTSFATLNKATNYKDMTDEINKYFHSVSRLLNEENATYELRVINDEDFQKELIVTHNVLGDIYETIIKYNEFIVKNDKNEKEIHLEGVIVDGEISYLFEGSQETDEEECEITLIIKVSDNNYIKVSQEIEGNEREFEYGFYNTKPTKNTKPYKEIEIEIEAPSDDQDGIFDVSVEVKEFGKEIKMNFSYDKKGSNNEVNVKFINENVDEEFKIKREDNEDYYSYHHKGKDNDDYDHVNDYNKHHGGKNNQHDIPSPKSQERNC